LTLLRWVKDFYQLSQLEQSFEAKAHASILTIEAPSVFQRNKK
jgi:hypothetical protein